MSVNRKSSVLSELRRWAEDPSQLDDEEEIKSLIAKIYKAARKQHRRNVQQQIKQHDLGVTESSGRYTSDEQVQTSATQRTSVTPAEPAVSLHRPRRCYICKSAYKSMDAYYHRLCPDCAMENHAKRNNSTDLTGRSAFLTGGRIKIGFYLALKMLRDGASLWITTRFPNDASQRFASQPDYSTWADRLNILQLNLLNLPKVESIASDFCEKGIHFDILINNAAQTIRRPQAFYRQLETTEAKRIAAQKVTTETDRAFECILGTENLSALIDKSELFPRGLLAADGQQLDLRDQNSWMLKHDQVSLAELLEVNLINSIAPYVLIKALKPGMLLSEHRPRFIINVSAMEGNFNMKNKTSRHPHTNMAKAALNMITRTSAEEFAKDQIYMNSVDTGWITDECVFEKRLARREQGWAPPLDEIDGAARVYDPIVQSLSGNPVYGRFLKDYKVTEW